MNNEQRTFESFLDEVARLKIHGMQGNYPYKDFQDWNRYLWPSQSEMIELTTEAAQRFAAWKARTTAIAFNKWMENHSWKEDYREQTTHSVSEHFDYWLKNVWKDGSGLPVEQGQKADGIQSMEENKTK